MAAATGPVGATVGQIGKSKVPGSAWLAGGEMPSCGRRARFRRLSGITMRMILPNSWRSSLPGTAIDVYYENVGGKVFDAVLPLLNTLRARRFADW